MAEAIKQRRLVRIGECARCGLCCYMKNLVTAPALQFKVNPKLLAFLETEQGSQVCCIHLEYDIEGKSVCAIYGTSRRPPSCTAHPSSPNSVTKGCIAFTFIERESE
jgi:hypothetical protein